MSAPRPVRVVFTMTFPERLGGCEDFLWTFLRHVDRGRVEPEVVFHGAGLFEREVAGLGMATATIPTGRLREPRRGLGAIRRLADHLRRRRPDLVMSWYTRAHLYTAPAAVRAGLRERLAWFQHTLPAGDRLNRPATLLPARAVGASSRAGADAQRRLWPHRPTFVVYPGIDEPPAPSEADAAALRARLGIPEGRAIVGSVGRLQEWKGHHHLLDVLERLREAGVDAHGLIVGGDAHGADPAYGPWLRRLVEERGMGGRVTVTGHVADAVPYLAASDVLLNASRGEPFGIVLLEAMALGVPAVAFDRGGPSEALADGAGLLVPPPDPAALAEAVKRLLGDGELREGVAARARRRFDERFRAERMAGELEGELLRLAESA